MRMDWIKRAFCLLLCCVMLLGNIPVVSFAAEADGLCAHHTEHTDCGYVEGEAACGFVCDACEQAAAEPEATEETEPEPDVIPDSCTHSYEAVVTAPTCTEDGYTTYTCAACGDTYTEPVFAKGHTMGDWVTTSAPNCTEAGANRRDCADCDYYETGEVDPLGHSYEAEVTDPTCTEDGYTTYTCTVCGDTYTEPVSAKGHTMGDWVTTTVPNCTEAGANRRDCADCAYYETGEVDALGHSYEAVVTDPTCTEGGYTTYTCTVCGDSYVDDTVSENGHSYEAVVTDPTCTEDGYTTYTCTVCGDSYVDDPVEATGHDYFDALCQNCGHDKLANYPRLSLNLNTGAVITQGDVDANNGIVYYVFEPDQTDIYRIISEASRDTYVHLYSADLYELAANDDGAGSAGNFLLDYELEAGRRYVYGIRFYNRSYTGTIPVLLTQIHSYTEEVLTPSTCVEQGNAKYTCSYCGHSYEAALPLAGHSYDEGVVTKPTCEEYGYTTYTCTVCDHSYQTDPTEPTGHSYKSAVTPPTCTEAGYITYTCVCEHSYIADDAAALGHSYADYKCVRCEAEEPRAHGTCGDHLYWEIDDNNVLVIYGSGAMYDYQLFETPWYDHIEEITGVAIGRRVTHIGSFAFCDLTSVTSLTIPTNVISIGESALTGCGSLTDLTIPFVGKEKYVSGSAQPLGYIFGQDPYTNCIGVEHINGTFYYVPKNLTTITVTGGTLYGYAFHNCTRLITINLRDNVVNLQENVFSGCTNLKTVNIAGGLKSIGSYTFKDCTSLETVSIGNSVTSIGYQAFYGCTSLKTVVLPNSLTYIESYAFYDCISLESIAIPEGITNLPYEVFYNCQSLASVTLPSTLTSIEWHTFYGCSSLKELELPVGLTSLGGYAFAYCTGLEALTIPRTLKIIPEYAFSHCTSLKSVTLPRGVTTIGEYAFSLCTSLTDISMASIAKIENGAFNGCTGLTGIELPAFLNTLGNSVFSDCTALESIVIPENIEELPDYLFSRCTALRDVTLSPTTKKIGNNTFSNCDALTDIVIPDSVESIGGGAFSECDALASIVIPDRVTSIGDSVFSNCDGLTSVVIPSGVTAIGNSMFYDCDSLASIVIPSGVTAIGNSMFYDCDSLASVVIPSSVTSIGTYAFQYCYALTDLVIPNSVESIGNYAFYYCRALTDIIIPDSVTSIGDRAFYYCEALKTVTLGIKVTSIGDSAFEHCNMLTELVIPDSVESIGTYAFQYCYALESLTLGSKVASIGDYAFDDCGRLEQVIFRGNAPAISEHAFRYWNTVAFYPAGNETWTQDVQQKYGADALRWMPYGDTKAPVLTVTADEADSYRSILSWTAVEGAVGYDIYGYRNARIDDESWGAVYLEKIASVTETTYTDLDITPGYWGMYAVVAVDETGAGSLYSNIVENQSKLMTPTLNSAKITEHSVTLSWTAVPHADCYTVYYAESLDGNYNYAGSTAEYADTEQDSTSYQLWLTPGKTYYFKVKAMQDITMHQSAASNILSADVPLRTPGSPSVWVNEENQIEVYWDRSDGAVSYELYRSETEKGTYKLISTQTDNRYYDSDWQTGHGYYYKVKAIAEDSQYNSGLSNPNSAYISLNDPILTVTYNKDGYPVFSWDKVEGATKYQLYRGYSDDGENDPTLLKTTTSTSYTYTGAPWNDEDGRPVYLVAVATDTRANSSSNYCWNAYRVPAQPKVTISNDSTTGTPKLSWKAVEGAGNGYAILRRTADESSYYEVNWTSETSWSDSWDKTPGTKYYYKIYACGNSGNSLQSDTVAITCDLPRPAVTITNNSSGNIRVTWSKISGAKHYTVYRAASKSGTYTALGSTKTTGYTDTSAVIGTTYYYKVVAAHSNSAANSAYSSVKSAAAKLATPSITVGNEKVSGKILVSWKAVSGASKYEVWRRPYWGDTFTKLTTTTKTSYTDSSAGTPNEDEFVYKVRALHSTSAGKSAYSAEKTGNPMLALPVVTAGNNASSGNITLKWNKIDGAHYYTVMRSEDGKNFYDWNDVGDTTSWTEQGSAAGEKFYYKIKAQGSVDERTSEAVSATHDLPRPKVKVSNVSASGKIKLSWSKIDGTKYYKIYRATSKSGTYKAVGTTKTTGYTDSDAAVGKTYYYKVIAVHSTSAANSAYSSVVSKICTLAQPKVTAANTSAGKIKLTWSKISGASKYTIYRATSKSGTYKALSSTKTTSYTDTSAATGKTYYYKVIAVHSTSAANSAYSSVVSKVCTLATPAVTVKLSSGDPKVSWKKISGASKYTVYRATSKSGTYSAIKTTTSLSYTDKSAKAGKTYYYKVKAVYKTSSANSAYSSVVSIKAK